MVRNSERETVLFVDDEPSIRLLAGRALTQAGYEFDQAGDGNQALNKMAERRYSALVTDLIMPEREGIEMIIEVRRTWPDTYIIAMSGGGRVGPDDFLKLAKMAGADRVLRKPFRPSDLLAALAAGKPTDSPAVPS